jgi:hypothetical protein
MMAQQQQRVQQDDAAVFEGLYDIMHAQTEAQDALLDDLCDLMQAHTQLVDQAVAWYHRRKCSPCEGCKPGQHMVSISAELSRLGWIA